MSDGTELIFEAIAIESDRGYASDYEYNGLYKVNMKSGICEYLGIFPDESANQKRIHCCAKWIGNKIYFIPAAGDKISIFHIDEESIESLGIPSPQTAKHTFYQKKYKFIEAVAFHSYLWLIPSTYPGVLRIDIRTNEIKVFEEWIPDTGYMFRKGLCIKEKQFLIPSGSNNAVLIFDMEKEIGNIVHVGMNNNGAMSMCSCDGRYWLAPRLDGAIISWEPNTGSVNEYMEYPSELQYEKIFFSKIYTYGGQIILVPASANAGLIISENVVRIDKSICWKEEMESNVEFLFETEEYLYFRERYRDRNQSRFFRVSKLTNIQTDYCFILPDSARQKQETIKLAIRQGKKIKESIRIGLQDLINSLM